MKAIASSLTIRFYQRHGWKKEILLDCIKEEHKVNGQLYIYDPFPSDENPYWTFTPGARDVINFDKLMTHITILERTYNDFPNDNDKDFIRKFI